MAYQARLRIQRVPIVLGIPEAGEKSNEKGEERSNYLPKINETNVPMETYIGIFTATLFRITKSGKPPKPSTDEWINKCDIYIQ